MSIRKMINKNVGDDISKHGPSEDVEDREDFLRGDLRCLQRHSNASIQLFILLPADILVVLALAGNKMNYRLIIRTLLVSIIFS